MSTDDVEKTTIENTVAISKLTAIAEQTSKDVDKMVSHLDKLLPMHTRVEGLEADVKELKDENNEGIRGKTLTWIVRGLILTFIAFGSFILLGLHDEQTEFKTYKATDEERHKNIDEDIAELKAHTNRNYGFIQGRGSQKIEKIPK